MSNQPRVVKVLVALLVSMTLGAIALLVLDDKAPSAGPFSLASYYRLESVEQAIKGDEMQYARRWNGIEVFFSRSRGGNISQLASLAGLSSSKNVNFHFLLGNGYGAIDGQIQTAERWKKQWSALPGGNWYGGDQIIRICLIGDSDNMPATDCQVKRALALIETLGRKFDIDQQDIVFPAGQSF